MAQLASAGDFRKISRGEWVINATDYSQEIMPYGKLQTEDP